MTYQMDLVYSTIKKKVEQIFLKALGRRTGDIHGSKTEHTLTDLN
jgi:hypothetical protein